MSWMTDETALDDLLCFQVYSLHHAFGRHYQATFAETGFTYAKYVVLKILKEAGPSSLSAVSLRAGVEANTLSPLVKKMASFGLIERVRDPEDERRILLNLLPLGETILQEASAVTTRNWEALGLDPAQVDAAARVLMDARAKLEAAVPKRMSLPDNTPD